MTTDRFLQILVFIILVTMPWWSHYVVDIDRNGVSITDTTGIE